MPSPIEPPKNRRVLVSGAGVAGMALAYWLRRHGFEPTVVERSPAPREGGHKIDIRGVAVDVAQKMGILPGVQEKCIFMQGGSWVDRDGKRIASMRADFVEARDDHSLEIMRGDLNRVLYEATRERVEYVFNDSIARIEETRDGLAVAFEHGASRTFDLVVGADGVRSNVRALLFGDESRFIHDFGGYHVVTFTVPNRMKLDRWDVFHVVPGKTMNVSSIREDADARAVFLFTAPGLKYDRRDVAQQRRLVADLFAHEGWEIPGLLREMWTAADFYFDTVSQVRMDRWSSGRAVLVGDAGYAPSLASGQGTTLALVGAYVLAGELAAAGGNHRAAFEAYERRTRSYVARNQKLGTEAVKSMVLRTRWQIWFMNLMIRLVPYMPWKGLISRWLKAVVHRASTAIVLEDYRAGIEP
jgi:2-polyprenyl-6-methoxyphenol hydroxylase-like FAD-dependent oxidoreductase